MELNQIVYVVNDRKEQKIIGAYNDYLTAKQVALDMNKLTYDGTEISITPVLVDSVNWVTDSRKYWLTESDVLNAVQEEIELAMPEDEDEDEDDDEYDDEYSDEDEDEEDYDDDDDDDESDSEDVIYTAIDRITDAILEIEKILDDLKNDLDDQ